MTMTQRATKRAGAIRRHPGADRCRVDPHEPVSVATALAVICYGLVNVWRASGGGTA